MHSSKFSIFNFQFSISRGFTLIELLIVITILGILAGLTVASYTSAQERSRDSRRKTDLDALKKALELAKNDTAGSYYYPSCDSYSGGTCALTNTSTNPDLTPASSTSPYIKAVPTDPKTAVGYTYIPTPANCGVNICTSYTLRACLENRSDIQGTTVASSICASTKAYQVTPN